MTMAMKRTSLIMHACPRCGGAAYLEDPQDGDWRCLQCGRTVPTPEPEHEVQKAPAAA